MGHPVSTGRRTRTGGRLGTAALMATAVTFVQAQGLSLHIPESSYPAHPLAEYALTNSHLTVSSIRVFGDYYFFDPAHSNMGPTLDSLVGGFRASTGLVGLAQPLSLYETRPDPLQSLPYIGLGYSQLWFNSQLRLNADFGLASQNHGRGLFSSPSSLDDVANQVRWAPVMAVNVRYSF